MHVFPEMHGCASQAKCADCAGCSQLLETLERLQCGAASMGLHRIREALGEIGEEIPKNGEGMKQERIDRIIEKLLQLQEAIRAEGSTSKRGLIENTRVVSVLRGYFC